jgi:hypothetical protein
VSDVQLRIYSIEPGRLEAFLAAWTAGVVPLRRRFGFSIDAWTVPDENTFVWKLTYSGVETFDAADLAYYHCAERTALDPDPAQFVVATQELWLRPIPVPGQADVLSAEALTTQ